MNGKRAKEIRKIVYGKEFDSTLTKKQLYRKAKKKFISEHTTWTK